MTEDMFGFSDVRKPNSGDTRTCHTCGEEKHKDEFYNHSLRPGGKSCYCIPCQNKHRVDLEKVRKTAPLPPEDCECCGRTGVKLLLDHCHKTITFRGWICGKCNTGIGSLGDTLEDVENARRYLQNVKERKAS